MIIFYINISDTDLKSLVIILKYFLKKNKFSEFSVVLATIFIIMLNNIFCSTTLYYLLCSDIKYHVNWLKPLSNSFIICCFIWNQISIIISGIRDLQLITWLYEHLFGELIFINKRKFRRYPLNIDE